MGKRIFSSSFKTKVARSLLKEDGAVADICRQYGIFPAQAKRWKQQAIDGIRTVFADSTKRNELKEKDTLIETLYQQIGQLTVERDFLKKKSDKTGRGP